MTHTAKHKKVSNKSIVQFQNNKPFAFFVAWRYVSLVHVACMVMYRGSYVCLTRQRATVDSC